MTTLDPQDPAAPGKQHVNLVGIGMGDGPGPDVMAASTLDGNKVMSSDGEHVGKISDIMLDERGGRIAYAVLSSNGFLGVRDTLHAIPWNALTLDTGDSRADQTPPAATRTTGHRWRICNGAPPCTSTTTGRRIGRRRTTW
jgi:sporulation protein YlmC with PRC-barrel domain